MIGPQVLELDAPAEVQRLGAALRSTLQGWHKRGVVVAISGGIDSAVCAALAVQALGPQRVFGLLLPEHECGPDATRLGLEVVRSLGIAHTVQDLTQALQGMGCYQERDEAVAEVVAGYGAGWSCKLTLAPATRAGFSVFQIVVRSPQGEISTHRLPPAAYLRIVAATNYKQRLRKAAEYFHADRLNHAVIGTPNRLEAELGFFVKGGDGAADLKPIAHLYKTQVYALAQHLGVPAQVQQAKPSTNTYSLEQGQDEFFYGLPVRELDLALWALEHGHTAAELAVALGMSEADAAATLARLASQRRAAAYLSAPPVRWPLPT